MSARNLAVGLLGGRGLLGREVQRVLSERGFDRLSVFDRSVDLLEPASLATAFDRTSLDVVINCAAWTDVERAESNSDQAHRVNATGVRSLSALLADRAVGLIHISTDYVFSGEQSRPYRASDPVGPLNEYGRSKRAGEEAVLASDLDRWWILRTSWLYGEGAGHFPARMAQLARKRPQLSVVDDQRGTPTSTTQVAEAIAAELMDAEGALPGKIEHLAGRETGSWADFAGAVIDLLSDRGDDSPLANVEPVTTEAFAAAQRAAGRTPPQARRPPNSALCSEEYTERTGREIDDWRTALRSTFDRYGLSWGWAGEENA